MGQERRYTEDEIDEIFALAATAGETRAPALTGQHGPTLGDLQEIGRAAGIDPQHVADAAQRIRARHEVVPHRTFLGMPVSVGRTIDLPRELTDREWELLVSDLRDIFGAGGQIGLQGAAREWSNGNLRVLLERAGSGQRLRITTLNGRQLFLNRICVLDVLIGIVFLAHALLLRATAFEPVWQLLPPLILALPGAVGLAWNRVNLPRWAREREVQMEQIADRARAMTDPGGADGSET